MGDRVSRKYFLTAVDTGLFRKLVVHLGGEKTTNFLPKDRIVREWMEIAKDLPGLSQKPRQTAFLFDENYLQALARRDPEAEGFLVAHFSRPIQMKLRVRLRSNDLVQDAQQETFLRILRYFNSGKTLDNPAALPGFVYTVCHNVALEFQRSGMRHLDLETAPKTVDAAQDRELLLLVDKAAACREYGIDRNYLRMLLQRALNRFRRAMAQAKPL
jgi:RNA polymerase sigma-70 factor, ECF subfamily